MEEQVVAFLKSPYYLMFVLWAVAWRGIALWKAATKRQAAWFIILLIVNSLSILEILYVFWLSRWSLDKDQKILGFLNEKIGKKVKTP
jgi:hypothetical protein